MKGNDLAGFGIHRQPNPLFVCLVLHKTRHFISFHLKTLNHDILITRDRLDIQMVRQGFETGDDKTQQPLEPHLDRTANPSKRDAFQQQTLNGITYFIRDQLLLKAIDKLAATVFTLTVFTLMVLLAVVNVTIFLIREGLATRTDLSDDHTHGELPASSQRFEQP